MDDEEYTWGRFEVHIVRGPAVVVDCTSWCEALGGDFTFGWFETDVVRGPAVEPPDRKPDPLTPDDPTPDS